MFVERSEEVIEYFCEFNQREIARPFESIYKENKGNAVDKRLLRNVSSTSVSLSLSLSSLREKSIWL